MVNVKSQARGVPGMRDGSSAVAEDPFAELAEIFESELKFDARFAEDAARRSASAAQRREPPLDLGSMEREFETAFESDMRAARPAAAAAPRTVGRAQPTHLTDEEIDGELESVLRSLSAPARPRGRIVVETQSFAPAREIEERMPQAPSLEVDEFEELIRSELAVIRPTIPMPPSAARSVEPPMSEIYGEETFYIDDDHDAANVGAIRSPKGGAWKRRMLAGASAAVFLLMAGAGYKVWQEGGTAGVSGGDADPLLIKADAEPYKIVPKDPGGRAYPNQNKAVYERVASPNRNDDTPVQQALISNAEEPVEFPKEDEAAYADSLPGVELGGTAEGQKDETRVSETTETDSGGTSILQPRKVKTMTVGSDGRFVSTEEPAAAAASSAPAGAAAPDIQEAAVPIAVASIAPAQPIAADSPPPAAKPVPAPAPRAVHAESPAAPAVGKPPTVQVASALPAGGYFVQVSSQPSEAAAQQSMRSFGSRHGSAVGDRPVGIQSAEIAGKGTFYRVRIAASSKEDAAALCSQLKSAGASCVVTR